MPTTNKISANTAFEEELAQRFEQADIPNAERWAEEVVEYRPYAAHDPNLRADPGPGVLGLAVLLVLLAGVGRGYSRPTPTTSTRHGR